MVGCFCKNHITVQLKKYRRVISHDIEEWCRVFKFDMRNLVNFHPNTQKSSYDIEQWCKIWINSDLVLSKITWGIGWTFITALKSLKSRSLMGSFCPKHITFQLANFRGITCHETGGCKIERKTDLWLEIWHKEFG